MKYDKFDSLIAFALILNGSNLISSVTYNTCPPSLVNELFDLFFILKKRKKADFDDLLLYPPIARYIDVHLLRRSSKGMPVVAWVIQCAQRQTTMQDILDHFEEYVGKYEDLECTGKLDNYRGYGFSPQTFDNLLIRLNDDSGYLATKRLLIIRDIIT